MKRYLVVVIGRALFQEHPQDASDQHDGGRHTKDDVEPLDRPRLLDRQFRLQQQVLAEQARDQEHDRHIM
jgi:hypothetical protein